MKLAKVKCPNCGKMINREEGIPYNKRYYCNDDCLFEAIGEDLYDQHMFYLHFQRIFDRIPSNLEWIQCTKMVKEEGWTWHKIEDVMEYVYEIEHLDESEEHGAIGILPYYELRAKQFFKKLWEVQESESFNTDDDEEEIICQQINSRSFTKQKENKDLDDIWEDEDLFDE